MSYVNTSFQQWLNGLEQRIQALEKQQKELEEANQKLKDQLAEAKKDQGGNITYKIQELHVNELKGTLNIGLTTLADEGQLKDMLGQMKFENLNSMGNAEHNGVDA